MTFDTTTILGFLSGSVATLFIKELFNQINKKKDFDRDIMRITYQKKLEKAEMAVSYYWTYFNKTAEIKKSYETFLKSANSIGENNFDTDIINSLLEENKKNLAELVGKKFHDINGIHLYFDLWDAEEWNEDDLGNVYQSLSELQYWDNELQKLASVYEVHIQKENKEKIREYLKRFKNILPKYVTSLENHIDLIEKEKKAVLSIICKIKEQL